jgi:hypothetical protein
MSNLDGWLVVGRSVCSIWSVGWSVDWSTSVVVGRLFGRLVIRSVIFVIWNLCRTVFSLAMMMEGEFPRESMKIQNEITKV